LTIDEDNDIFAEAFWLVATSDETYPDRVALRRRVAVAGLFVTNL
jgi:hypothetical protein